MAETNQCPECGAELTTGETQGLCPKCLMKAGLDSEVDKSPPDQGVQTSPHSGGFSPPAPETLATHFPFLEILELAGHGGMGAVYKARQPKLDRLVALKIIRPETADDPAFAERFHREARMLAQLSHPNIVSVHDFGEVSLSTTKGDAPSTLYYFLMEFVDGVNLRQLIQGGEIRPSQALTIIPQICEALQFAHDEGVVHRDIKPENVLLNSKGQVKIADFGLAKLSSPSDRDFTLTGTHQVMGTPRYMAPEQMEGSRGVDHRADIYSLGVVFYEMLTGQIPAGHFDPPSKKVQVDVRVDEVVLRSLAREPERRYQHASDVKSDVESISQGRSNDAAKPSAAASTLGKLAEQDASGTMPGDDNTKLAPIRWQVFSSMLAVGLLGHGLIGLTMAWTASPWPLAGLALLWFLLGAAARYNMSRPGAKEGFVNLVIGMALSVGLTGYGVMLTESPIPLFAVIAGLAAAVGGGAFAETIEEELEKQNDEPVSDLKVDVRAVSKNHIDGRDDLEKNTRTRCRHRRT